MKEERAQLNEKLVRVAAEKAELEHVLVQLQEENESIADYVSLYREQRSALLAKQNRREQMLHTLLHERKLLSACTLLVSSHSAIDNIRTSSMRIVFLTRSSLISDQRHDLLPKCIDEAVRARVYIGPFNFNDDDDDATDC